MKYALRIAVIGAVVFFFWQVLGPEIINFIFQDDLKDSAAQMGYRTGVAPLSSDEDIRNIVIHKAERHDIVLDPRQITVERIGTGEATTWYIVVDYTVIVDLLVYKLPLHFRPTSRGGGFWARVESPPPPAKPVPAQKGKQQK